MSRKHLSYGVYSVTSSESEPWPSELNPVAVSILLQGFSNLSPQLFID